MVVYFMVTFDMVHSGREKIYLNFFLQDNSFFDPRHGHRTTSRGVMNFIVQQHTCGTMNIKSYINMMFDVY